MIDYILNPQTVDALGWTLLHSLWQGACFAILLVVILILMRSYSSQSRYVVSVGLLCTFFLTVSATFYQQVQESNSRFEVSEQIMNEQKSEEAFVHLTSIDSELKSELKSQDDIPVERQMIAMEETGWLDTFRDYYNRHLPLLVTLWLLGVLFLQLRFLGQLAYVQRLKHYGTQLFPASWNDKIEELENKLRIQKNVQYLTSIRVESPMVIGWLKPAVLLPRQLFDRLTETEIYAVLAHEIAHIRREDFVVNLLQTFLCNVFFFHPGVWWISNQIDDEREHCCDDLAVAATGPASSYAKTLINVSEFQLSVQNNPALAVAFSGKSTRRERGGFSGRIRRLFMASNGSNTFREGFATACILITALFLGAMTTGSTVQEAALDLATDTELSSEKDTPNNQTVVQNNELKDANQNNQNITNSTSITENFEDDKSSEEVQGSEIIVREESLNSMQPDETRIDALIMACEEGDIEFVKTLVGAGIDINGIGSESFTPLMVAAGQNETEIVAYLLKNGAQVNKVSNGWTALLESADEGSVESMKQLLQAGADVNYYATPLSPAAISMAASEGKLECLRLLLENGADINGIGKSIPPLHIAAEEDQRHIIDYLISQNVSLNKEDSGGRTALMYAASEDNEYVVKQLVEAGADMSIVDVDGFTAEDYAEDEQRYSITDYLPSEKIPELHQATLNGLIEKVERIVDLGEDINSRDDYGRTPLHIAAALNHNIDMRLLINLGADLNAKDNQGRTPLMYAAAEGQSGAATLLVSYQADVEIKDEDGMRAFEWAHSGGNAQLVNFLGLLTKNKMKTDHRIDTNVNGGISQLKSIRKKQEKSHKNRIENKVHNDIQKDIHKDTHKDVHHDSHKDKYQDDERRETFHIDEDGVHLRQFDVKNKIPELLELVRNGSVDDCAKLLNDYGESTVNLSDDTGQTALMVATSNGRLDIVKLLIQKGADVNMSSFSGLTALHYAALENQYEIAQLLIKNKAKVDPTMRYSSTDGNYKKEPIVWEYIGATPLLIAVEAGNVEVLSVLIDAGADKNHRLIKNEYILDKNRESYLSASEVMGLDQDFLNEVEAKISKETWSPYKQAKFLNQAEVLVFFTK